jgi:hypothetical protein
MATTPRGRAPAPGNETLPAADTQQDVAHAATIGTGPVAAAGTGSDAVQSSDEYTMPRTSASSELPAGEMVGEYRVERKIGQGGMGIVYGAVHPLIGKRAAIKVLSRQLCMQPEAVERFVTEARSVNQIGHPNIVDVFSFGNLPDGRSYFVMEWLEGKSLAERLRKGRMSIGEVIAILDEVAEALEAAHAKRIVHRDLKPDNIFLVAAPGGKTKVTLLDFGIAKLLDDSNERITKTRTGSLMGTPLYVAPEQARGYEIDARVDIYSLGAVAFEMLTGKPPFIADNAMDVVSMHLHDEPPRCSSVMSGVPAQLDDILLATLAKEPDDRPTLPELRAVLATLRNTADLALTPSAKSMATQSTRRTTKTPWIALAAGIVVIGGVIAVFTMGGGGKKATTATGTETGTGTGTGTETGNRQPATGNPQLATGSAASGSAAAVADPIVVKDAFAPGKLSLRVEEKGATVEIDDQAVTLVKGAASLTLPAGLHRAVIRAPGHHDKLVEFELVSGSTLELKPDLDRKRGGSTRPPVASGSGSGSSAGSGASTGSATKPPPPVDNSDVVVNPFKKNP